MWSNNEIYHHYVKINKWLNINWLEEHSIISKYLSNTFYIWNLQKKIDNLLMILCNHNMRFHFFVKYIRDVRISLSVLTISRFSKTIFILKKVIMFWSENNSLPQKEFWNDLQQNFYDRWKTLLTEHCKMLKKVDRNFFMVWNAPIILCKQSMYWKHIPFIITCNLMKKSYTCIS